MSSTALLFGIVCVTVTGMLFGALVMQLINDAREIRRIKRENRLYARGEINQVDFIGRIAEYEAAKRAEVNRAEVLQEWIENCKAQAETDKAAKARAKQKKQIKDQLEKAKIEGGQE